WSRTSRTWQLAVAPDCCSSAAVLRAASGRMSATATLMPPHASRAQMALPRPPPPPVTSATLPSSRDMRPPVRDSAPGRELTQAAGRRARAGFPAEGVLDKLTQDVDDEAVHLLHPLRIVRGHNQGHVRSPGERSAAPAAQRDA